MKVEAPKKPLVRLSASPLARQITPEPTGPVEEPVQIAEQLDRVKQLQQFQAELMNEFAKGHSR